MKILDILRRQKQTLLGYYRHRIDRHLKCLSLRSLPIQHPLRNIPIYVINLERDTVKRRHIQKQFRKLGITNFSFFKAIDGSSYDTVTLAERYHYSAYHAELFEQRQLPKSIVALSATHFALYSLIVENNIPEVLIVEDDAIFDDSATHSFKLPSSRIPYHVCLLEAWIRSKPPGGRIEDSFFSLASYKGGTAAYLITKTGAELLLSMSNPLCHPPDGNLTWYNRHREKKELHFANSEMPPLNVVLSYPFPVINGSLAGYWPTSCNSPWIPY
jgi:GR25 family glycosyltransferase involved in LPS biosynthesis